MKIIFAYELDSASFPDALGHEAANQGTVVLGPLGLVGVLEMCLGLSGVRAPQAVRIAQYLNRLREVNDGGRFYSRSLQADAWSVAKQLLAWRDELVMSGWHGVVPEGATPRLQDLAVVEQPRHLELAPGLGERLNVVLDALRTGRKLDLQLIQLVEQPASLPPSWGLLFKELSQQGVPVEVDDHAVQGVVNQDILLT